MHSLLILRPILSMPPILFILPILIIFPVLPIVLLNRSISRQVALVRRVGHRVGVAVAPGGVLCLDEGTPSTL